MEFEKNIRNDLFKRQEISFNSESSQNLGFSEIRKQISEQVGKPEENIDVYNIKGSFGSNIFTIDAYVYDSKEDLDKAEQKTQKQRKAEASEEKKASEEIKEKPVEEIKEPAEKPKEESGAPAEEKPEQVKEKPAQEPVEAPAEEKPDEEAKAVKEEKQAEEESKEP